MTFSSDARIIDYSAIIKMTVFQKHTYHSQGKRLWSVTTANSQASVRHIYVVNATLYAYHQ